MWAVVAPRDALDGLLRVTCMVSFISSRTSSTTVTVRFLEVCPEVKVRVPESRV